MYALSIIGAKETIKDKIINEGANSDYVDGFKKQIKSLVETNAEERYEEELDEFKRRKNELKTSSRKGLRSRSGTTKEINAAVAAGDGTVLGPNGVVYTWDGLGFTTSNSKGVLTGSFSPEEVYSLVAKDDAANYKPVPLP